MKRDFVKRPLGQTPTVAWSDPKQSVELQWVKLPHGSKGRKLWVVVGNAEHAGADSRLYPHPANVMGDGRLILTPFLIGDDTDRAKKFTLSVVAAEGKAAQELDDYYHSACEDCDWKGIPRHAWPSNGMDTLLETTVARL
ncbi:MAG TPA: hypothetical protein VGK50_08555 [Coriobacteriia bacterium]